LSRLWLFNILSHIFLVRLELLEKVRTQKNAWNRAVDLSAEKAARQKIERMSIQHVVAPQAARQFEHLLRAALPAPTILPMQISPPGLSVPGGAGMLAVVFVAAN
jgi:fatty acid-binding protein DegV